MLYTYVGTVLPDTNRINSSVIAVQHPAGADHPTLKLRIQVLDNRIIAACDVSEELNDVACLTIRNIVEDVASSVCDSVALLQGAWTVVTVDTCVDSDGRVRMHFSNTVPRLKEEFARRQVTPEDITAINRHSQGFHLRLALDDLNAGLMEKKFLRSHCYKVVEALKNSVTAGERLSGKKKWNRFREALGVDRTTLDCLIHQEERHGDYANARPMSGAEVGNVLAAIAEVISAYIRWFRREKLDASADTP